MSVQESCCHVAQVMTIEKTSRSPGLALSAVVDRAIRRLLARRICLEDDQQTIEKNSIKNKLNHLILQITKSLFD